MLVYDVYTTAKNATDAMELLRVYKWWMIGYRDEPLEAKDLVAIDSVNNSIVYFHKKSKTYYFANLARSKNKSFNEAGKAYRLKKQNGGSERYGKCERCHGDVDLTYSLTSLLRREKNNKPDGLSQKSTTFGHKKCLSELTDFGI